MAPLIPGEDGELELADIEVPGTIFGPLHQGGADPLPLKCRRHADVRDGRVLTRVLMGLGRRHEPEHADEFDKMVALDGNQECPGNVATSLVSTIRSTGAR